MPAATACGPPRPPSSTSTRWAATCRSPTSCARGRDRHAPRLRAAGRAPGGDRRPAAGPGARARRTRRPAFPPTRRRCGRAGGRRSPCSRRATRSPTTTGPPTPTRTSRRPRSARARDRPRAAARARRRGAPRRPPRLRPGRPGGAAAGARSGALVAGPGAGLRRGRARSGRAGAPDPRAGADQ